MPSPGPGCNVARALARTRAACRFSYAAKGFELAPRRGQHAVHRWLSASSRIASTRPPTAPGQRQRRRGGQFRRLLIRGRTGSCHAGSRRGLVRRGASATGSRSGARRPDRPDDGVELSNPSDPMRRRWLWSGVGHRRHGFGPRRDGTGAGGPAAAGDPRRGPSARSISRSTRPARAAERAGGIVAGSRGGFPPGALRARAGPARRRDGGRRRRACRRGPRSPPRRRWSGPTWRCGGVGSP